MFAKLFIFSTKSLFLRLSLTQIADLMNFTSLSYFSRYCTKHLGQSPSEYRQSLQPK